MKGHSYLEIIESQASLMVDRVMQWANVNSGSYNVPGLERMATLITQAFSELECEGNVLSLPPIEQIDAMGICRRVDLGPMLRFWKRPDAPIQVLLAGHMDTVYGSDHPFQKAIRQSENRILGPGVTDMKGGLCIMLESLKAFESNPETKQLGWEVIINPDEEISSLASAAFLEERAKFHQVGLLFEPAMDEKGTLAGERKGAAKFTIVVHGRAAHAGRDFASGRNAIHLLSEVIVKVHALNGKRSGVTLNVGLVQGGSAVNVVPELAICRIDIRLNAVEDEDWIHDQLKTIIANSNEREGFLVELKGKITRKPKILTKKMRALYDLIQETGKSIHQNISWEASGGCTDGNNLAGAGLPNIDSLGVSGGKIHSDQEYLLVDSLISRTKLTTALLFDLNAGKFKG